MAINLEPAASPAVVPNTVPDPFRKYFAMALAIVGGLILILGILMTVFPQVSGNAGAALQWGATLLAGGGFTIWDRQTPAGA
jgi:uncharacterized membrane protein YccC